jgi:hypothetical protein
MSVTAEVLAVPKSTVPAVAVVNDLLKLSVVLYGYTKVDFTKAVQTTFAAAVAQVLGVNPSDITITSIKGTKSGNRRLAAASAAAVEVEEAEAVEVEAGTKQFKFVKVEISINQATKADATVRKAKQSKASKRNRVCVSFSFRIRIERDVDSPYVAICSTM